MIAVIPFCMIMFSSASGFDIREDTAVFRRAVPMTLRQEYDSVLALFDSVIARRPSDPAGFYFKMMTLEARMIDYENRRDEKEFFGLYEKNSRRMDSLLQIAEDPWLLYFKGASLMALGLHELRFSKIFTGSRTLLKGIHILERCRQRDPALADALFYLSLYQYARHQIVAAFSWVTFWSRETDRSALSLLERCAREAVFSREIAQQALIGLYTREKEYARAESLALQFKADYPGNRAVYWLLAGIYEKMNEPARALEVYGTLQGLVERIPGGSPYNQASLASRQAILLFKIKRYGDCRDLCAGAERFKRDVPGDSRLSGLLKEIRKTGKKALKELEHEKR